MKSITKVEEAARMKELAEARAISNRKYKEAKKIMDDRLKNAIRGQEKARRDLFKREQERKKKLARMLELERKESLTAWERPAFDGRGRPTGLLQSVMPKWWPIARKLQKKMSMKNVQFITTLSRNIKLKLKEGDDVLFTPIYNGVVCVSDSGERSISASLFSKNHFASMIPFRVQKVGSRFLMATLAREPQAPFEGMLSELMIPVDAATSAVAFEDIIVVFHDRLKLENNRISKLSKNPELQNNERVSVYKIQFKGQNMAKNAGNLTCG